MAKKTWQTPAADKLFQFPDIHFIVTIIGFGNLDGLPNKSDGVDSLSECSMELNTATCIKINRPIKFNNNSNVIILLDRSHLNCLRIFIDYEK
jgi:hypothetical protein